MQEISHIADIADWPWIVEAVLLMVLGYGFRRGRLAQCIVGRVDLRERHQEEYEYRDAEGHDRQCDEPPADKAQKVVHALPFLLLRT